MLAEHVIHDRDVVRRDVPEGVDVGTDPTEVHAARVHVEDLAELARIVQVLDAPNRGVEDERVAGHQDPLVLFRAV